jgi:uncharacterized SAM-binding protein YcdF (DUF218 family)
MYYDTKHPRKSSDYLVNARLLIPALRLQRAIEKIKPPRPALGVCLGGDSKLRLEGTIALFRIGKINHIIVSGGVNDPKTDNLAADAMKQYLVDRGIPAEIVDEEGRSKVTDDHPVFVNPIVKERGYQDVIVITSRFHLLRAYLRFLAELENQNYPYKLYGYAVGEFSSWFHRTPTEEYPGILNFYLVELTKIRKYRRLASFQQAQDYVYHSLPK